MFLVGCITGMVRPAGQAPGLPDAAATAPAAPATGRLLPRPAPQQLDLAGAGYDLPTMASVYAARVVDAGDGLPPTYTEFVAGDGASARDFWPASSIKLLAALGALEFAASLGFTGAATVAVDGGYTFTLREIYRSALVASDNFDYDMLIRIAGFDRLNESFLSPANGFPTTVIQRSYAGIDVRWSPAMTLTEGGLTVLVPPREGEGEFDCPDEGNCTDLFELAEAVRRLVLDPVIAASERLAIAAADVQGLSAALAEAGSFFESGAERVLGPDATVLGKPGVAAGLHCVDAALVTGPAGDRYLLSAAVPDDDADLECEELSELAAAVLPMLVASP